MRIDSGYRDMAQVSSFVRAPMFNPSILQNVLFKRIQIFDFNVTLLSGIKSVLGIQTHFLCFLYSNKKPLVPILYIIHELIRICIQLFILIIE